MSNKEKVFISLNFWAKKNNWESWSKNFLLHGLWEGYKKLLVSNRSMSGIDKIITQDEYQNAMEGETDLDKKVVKLGEFIGLLMRI